jgi:hypothetical protein
MKLYLSIIDININFKGIPILYELQELVKNFLTKYEYGTKRMKHFISDCKYIGNVLKYLQLC